jgi:ABC-type molybdate transport system substrate-binding protein
MKLLIPFFALLFLSIASVVAQPAKPAVPADPNQARPASPVLPDPVPQMTPSTNDASATPALVKDDDLDWFDLIGTEWKKISLGNPDEVASGRVAERALQKHDLLGDDHKDFYVYAQTENLALAAVQREQSDAVFAFKTDVTKLNLPGFDTFPVNTADAPPVFYTASVCRLAKNPVQARAFIDFCGSDAGKAIWTKYGFETN